MAPAPANPSSRPRRLAWLLAFSGAYAATCAGAVARPLRQAPRAAAVIPVVTCAEARARLAEAGRSQQPSPAFAFRTASMPSQPDAEGSASIRCDGDALPVRARDLPLTGDGLRVGGSSLFVVRTVPATAAPRHAAWLQVERVCLGCDTLPTRSAPEALFRALLAALLALGGVAVLRHARGFAPATAPRLARLFGAAPRDAEALAPARCESLVARCLDATGGDAEPREVPGPVVVERDGRLVAGARDTGDTGDTRGPRAAILLQTPDASYRALPGEVPLLAGPGAVNGLAVPAGRTSPLQDGDVVRLGDGARFVLGLAPSAAAPLVRYHHAPGDWLRVLRPRRPGWIAPALAGVGLAAVGWGSASRAGFLMTAACLGAFLAVAAGHVLVPRRRAFGLTFARPSDVRDARVEPGGDGSFRVVVREGPRGERVIEEVPPLAPGAPPEARALHAALRREAEAVAARLRGRSA